MRLMRLIREDLAANPHAKSKFVLTYYRLAHASLHSHRAIQVAGIPLRVSYRLVVDWLMGIDIPSKTRIGRRPILYHGHSLVINEGAIIGDDCILRHSVTIGNKITESGESKAPHVGNGVEFGAGAVVIGAIEIGDFVTIGALSVVTRSVPPNTTVAGNPARPLEKSTFGSLTAGSNQQGTQ